MKERDRDRSKRMQVLQVLQDCDEVRAGDGDGDNNRIKKASQNVMFLALGG